MRTTPMIGRKAWFGPKRTGYGLSPVTVEGWATLVTGIVATAVLGATVSGARWVMMVPVVVMLALVFLKGTSMGGAAEYAEYRAARNRERTR